ncbi:nuclear transport factor 2 family protein [Burkholderia stabilis]|uniref:Nuclear transport factor 2 family protein n=2 Tax=Burkholderia stabilis TaxID=95485 RepID=A0A4Q2A7T6_9BURK|nr:nuclear transport factor 2 family protein [Burkholderia stabilis]
MPPPGALVIVSPSSTSTRNIMTPQETIDRIEIQDLLTRYCHAIDRQDWREFERLFASNAMLDYAAFGGPVGNRAEIAAYLKQVTSAMRGTQHTISTSLLIVDGDAATARTAGQVMMVSADETGDDRVCFVGLWYRDLLVRTECGWRIQSRMQERSWMHNAPPVASL